MVSVAKFEKVSFEQFKSDWQRVYGIERYTDSEIVDIYNKIKLPCRATRLSAGADFFSPIDITLEVDDIINIPTGIKCKIEEGWVLQIYNRSGHGFKCGLHLANTVGIIDGDYYNNVGNEGHIFVKLVNDSILSDRIVIKEGEAICQGVFVQFGIAIGDETDKERAGGLGSTSNR